MCQFRRKHGQKLATRPILQLVERTFEVGVELFYRSWHVPGENLAGVVKDAVQGSPARVEVSVKIGVTDHYQGMGDDCYVQAVFLNILRHGIAHQPPTTDVLHPRKEGKKIKLIFCFVALLHVHTLSYGSNKRLYSSSAKRSVMPAI